MFGLRVVIINEDHVTGQVHRFEGPVGAPFMALTHDPFYHWTYGQRRMVPTQIVRRGPPNGSQTIQFYMPGVPEPIVSPTRNFWFDHFGRRWAQVEGYPPRPYDTPFGKRALAHDQFDQQLDDHTYV